ncbi:hypothetical protein DPMN_111091 [Dreissena polymorpha]|uniref:Uncharacterized protein n=1 Tax=Dreissena polymorpha TaxID=45954 RepID=A0A9D4QPJ5_DREPO|nr:hypothetical protein DPMN_111091 [Dreissena polymorpha]
MARVMRTFDLRSHVSVIWCSVTLMKLLVELEVQVSVVIDTDGTLSICDISASRSTS